MKKFVVVSLLAVPAVFIGCASSNKPAERSDYMGKKVEAVSSVDNKRPFWTFDGGWKIEELRKHAGDSLEEPKYAYVVTSAAVKNETAMPQCYAMAKTRASAEVGRQISETVKEAKAMSGDAEETEFQSEIRSKASNIISGTEELEKFNLKIAGDDEDKPYRCWILVRFPRKNLKTLQGYVLKALEKEAGGNPDLKANVQNATKQMMEEM